MQNLNYSPIALGATILLSLIFWWMPGIAASKWFKGEAPGIRRPAAGAGMWTSQVKAWPGGLAAAGGLYYSSCVCPHSPTNRAPGPVRNVDMGNKTEVLAEAFMQGELDETDSTFGNEGGIKGHSAGDATPDTDASKE